MHAGPLQGPSLRPLFRLSLTRCSIFALTRCYLRPQDVDPKAVTFYERDVEGEQKPMAIPAEKLEQGWLAVLQYIRELREQVRNEVLNRWKGDRTVTQARIRAQCGIQVSRWCFGAKRWKSAAAFTLLQAWRRDTFHTCIPAVKTKDCR